MKRLANFFLILVLLLITVQPQVLLHFCGEKFVTFYINHNPDQISSACNVAAVDIPRQVCTHSDSAEQHNCPGRNIRVVDVQTEDFITQSGYTLPVIPSISFVYPLYTQPEVPISVAVSQYHSKSPPQLPYAYAGRDILTRLCTYII
ncbi:MAG: hypothetical protein ACRDDZ_04770 [Marinifilaceae bacterium]